MANIVELRDEVQDLVTGFKGFVTGMASYITGCDQASVIPKIKKDGQMGEGCWFDVNRLKVLKKGAIKLKIAPSAATGGPQDSPSKM